ncbi:GDP-L-fucose synthase [bacterium BMS3Bbin14]|nr:GDP-L-fucose synthase [bacterium BMS3Abin13]GBE52703.1 GDP-L-fucose synthase [bacterium BMS3Bbin14]HDK43704.1 SDR family oxidoreductase [Desulfobacteraceae bacterium]HDL98575.1 SDR family oxidoreductase [Desulfobacteraceae bacterium]HDO29584.1 SDR family oxidoreductase [Desulfobacteraceae bacterium]
MLSENTRSQTSLSGIQVSGKRLGVLIGGSGLIGGTLAYYFKTRTAGNIDIRAPSSKKLSIRNVDDIKAYLTQVQPDFVINTAIAAIDSDAHLAFEVNYLGSVNLARACCALGIPYIHISSAVTLPNGENLVEDDHLPLAPGLTHYAKSKLMAERTLRYMRQNQGLDFTAVRLAVVYGEHDHKIQGFHRLLFSIADESMPFMITRKGVRHSYTNANKIPYFVHHVLDHREEFSGETYHFVDKDPVELADLILTIRSYLEQKRPRELYVPYPVIRSGKFFLQWLAGVLNWFGISVCLPPELMFLENFYKSQTLSCEKLHKSSFIDPFPDETVYTALPRLVVYYLTRWGHLNLITTFNDEFIGDFELEEDFVNSPGELLNSIHTDSVSPFPELRREDKN